MGASSAERYQRAGALFDEALDRPPEAREAYLASACGHDDALRAEVQRLLDAHEAAGAFLDAGAVEVAAPLLGEAWDNRHVALPERLGAFRVVREIGHGGMGAVFLAERDDGQFAQRVAIKLVHPLGGHDRLVPRFLEERRILARLEHPGIARLIDGGVTLDGTPWFAMEYVEGVPIDQWCDARALPIDQRLALFRSACKAVQYAHQQFVVHRDLKPSNILVNEEGEVRLLDFGIAKFIAPDSDNAGDPSGDPSGDRSGNAFVSTTTFRVMTPQYAAPEQVRGEPVSAATDVYALGVLLYQLLTGRRPYGVRGASPSEIERLVCEVEPPRPSSTFEAGTQAAADDLVARCDLRSASPDRLRRALRGDLDAIVMQAMRKDPARRYPTASALLEDLERFAHGHPVVARPDSRGYRLRRFVRRNRTLVGAVATLIVMLAAGTVRERTLRRRAEHEARKAQAVSDFILSVFTVSDPFAGDAGNTGEAGAGRGRDVTARQLLDRGVTRVDRELTDEPALASDLRALFARVYTGLGSYDAAERQARRALAERRILYGPRHVDVAEAMDALGQVLVAREQFDDAEHYLREALALRRDLLGGRDPATLASLDHLGTLLQGRGALAQADTVFREALVARRGADGRPPSPAALATALNNLALLYFIQGRYDEAEPLYREALPLYERTIGADHPTTAAAVQNLAQVQQLRGHPDEAERLYRTALQAKRRALGDHHPSVTISLNNLSAFLARERGKLDEADSLAGLAVSLDKSIFGADHGFVAAGLNNQSFIARMRGDFARAAQLAREAVRIGRAALPSPSKDLAAYINSVGTAEYARDDLPAATGAYRDALAEYRRALGERHLYTQTVAVNLGRTLRERGLLDEADALFRGALATLDSAQGAHRTQWLAARVGHAQVLLARGDAAAARALLEPAYLASRTVNGESHWRTAEGALALSESRAATGDRAGALTLARSARDALVSQIRAQPRLVAMAERAVQRLEPAAPPGDDGVRR